jgi:predicted ATPase
MVKLKVRNFGPIKEGLTDDDGFLDIDKLTMFIGAQGSGKSSIAKLLTTCMWMEKALNRGDIEEPGSLHGFQMHCKYFGLYGEPYFRKDTHIEYFGDKFSFRYNPPGELAVTYTQAVENKDYVVPKVMYMPAERNFLMVLKDAMAYKNLPAPLAEFASELRFAQRKATDEAIHIPINNVKYRYDDRNDQSFLMTDDYELDLTKAASGFQSSIPVFLVTKYLADVINQKAEIHINNMSGNQRIIMNDQIASISLDSSLSSFEREMETEKVKAKFINKAFVNIVEEPEQNLYPDAQRSLLNYLLKYNNFNDANKLVLTTHSPYIINYLSLAIQAQHVNEQIGQHNYNKGLNELANVVPLESLIKGTAVNIYQMDEKTGSIQTLEKYEDIPSDNNFLNQSLQLGNEYFDQLLEIEQKISQ